jgi:hypothetical protein
LRTVYIKGDEVLPSQAASSYDISEFFDESPSYGILKPWLGELSGRELYSLTKDDVGRICDGVDVKAIKPKMLSLIGFLAPPPKIESHKVRTLS